MAETPVRFGIIGCANIARKVSRTINLSPNSIITALGSRSIETASSFASSNGFPSSVKLYGSYAAVLDDPFQEKAGPFHAVANSTWAELSLGIEPSPTENIVATDLPQEALMVTEFSRLVGNIKRNGSKADTRWPILSRKTQAVIDAVMASIRNGFEAVEVVY